MILSYRRTEVPELDARVAVRAVVHPQYRLHVVDNRRVIAEDALFLRAGLPRKGHLSRPIVTVFLEGEARVRAFGREEWLRPGDVSVVGAKCAIEMRQQGARFRSLVLEWEPGSGFGDAMPDTFSTAPVTDAARRRMTEIAEALLAPSLTVPDATPHVRDLFAALAALGLPVAHAPEGLVKEVPPQDVLVSRALDAALSDLGGRPMIVDLDQALGLSARQVTRVVTSFNERYGFNAGTWQDTRSRRRQLLGAGFMTVPGATTESIARHVGYGSPSAFGRALAAARLPAPGNVRDAVLALT